MRFRFSMFARAGLLVASGAVSLFAQPAITAVQNSASYETGIAQGSLFVIKGSNLGPASLVVASSLPFGSSVSGTSVTFTPVSGGAAVPALMYYTLAGQVSGILPSSTPVGEHNVVVTYNGQASAPFRAQVTARNFGLYTLASSGTGPAVAQIFASATQVVVNEFTAPARPGQVIVLYGTGLGPIGISDANLPGAQDLRASANIRVLVGGIEVNPDYAGRSPALPGVDQINFTLPANVAGGCIVPMQVRVGNVTSSKPVSLAIAGPGADICSFQGLDPAAIRRLANRETLTFGAFDLSVANVSVNVPILGSLDIGTETIGGSFSRINLANVTQFGGLNAFISTTTIGACVVSKAQTNGLSLDLIEDTPPVNLNAGPALTLNGPNVANKSVPRLAAGGEYSAELRTASIPLPGQPPSNPVVAAGEYTLTGPGGPDVGAFSARIRVPTPLNWTNRNDIARINRTQPLTLNWTGGGNDTVTIFGGASIRRGSGQNAPYDSTFFVCNQRASAGTFTVPTAVLQQLPTVTADVLTQASSGILALSASPSDDAGRFTAPLTAGGNVDYAVFLYNVAFVKLLDIQ